MCLLSTFFKVNLKEMTIIVGLVSDDGTVVIGSDSAATAEDALELHTAAADSGPKVFAHPAGFMVGFCGSFRVGQLVRHCFSVVPALKSQEPMAYLVGPFTKALRKCLKDSGCLETENGIETMDASLLLAYKNKLYVIQSDFQVSEPFHGYTAIGSGSAAALGSLYANKDLGVISAYDAALAAMLAAESVTPSVRGPFYVLES